MVQWYGGWYGVATVAEETHAIWPHGVRQERPSMAPAAAGLDESSDTHLPRGVIWDRGVDGGLGLELPVGTVLYCHLLELAGGDDAIDVSRPVHVRVEIVTCGQ